MSTNFLACTLSCSVNITRITTGNSTLTPGGPCRPCATTLLNQIQNTNNNEIITETLWKLNSCRHDIILLAQSFML